MLFTRLANVNSISFSPCCSLMCSDQDGHASVPSPSEHPDDGHGGHHRRAAHGGSCLRRRIASASTTDDTSSRTSSLPTAPPHAARRTPPLNRCTSGHPAELLCISKSLAANKNRKEKRVQINLIVIDCFGAPL